MACAQVRSSVKDPPDKLHGLAISDHSPVAIEISKGKTRAKEEQPISHAVAESNIYKHFLEELEHQFLHPQAGVVERWSVHKTIIREAARRARNWLLNEQETCKYTQGQIHTSIARAIWGKDVARAGRLQEQNILDLTVLDTLPSKTRQGLRLLLGKHASTQSWMTFERSMHRLKAAGTKKALVEGAHFSGSLSSGRLQVRNSLLQGSSRSRQMEVDPWPALNTV